MRRTLPTVVSAYIVAGVATALAVLLRWLLDPWMGDALPLVTAFGAVAIAVWYGGYRPALFAMLLGYVACNYFFIEPRGSLRLPDGGELIGQVLYVFTCSIVIGFGEAMRRVQRRATERQHLLHSTLASIGDAVITTDTQGRITSLNSVAESLTGWTQQEVMGQPLDAVVRLVNESTREAITNPATPGLRGVGPASHTVLIRRDTTERPVDASAAPITGAPGQILGSVLVLRDMTAPQKAAR